MGKVIVVEPAGTAVEDAEGTDRNAVGTAEHDAGVGPDLCRTDHEVVVGESGVEAGVLDHEQVAHGASARGSDSRAVSPPPGVSSIETPTPMARTPSAARRAVITASHRL